MAIPFLDLSNVTKWFGGLGSGTPADPFVLALGRNAPVTPAMTSVIVNLSASGDTTLIAGVTSQTVKVHKMVITYAAAPVTVLMKDGASTTLLTIPLNTYGGLVLDFDGEPWLVTASGNGLVVNLSSAVQIYGRVYYTQG